MKAIVHMILAAYGASEKEEHDGNAAIRVAGCNPPDRTYHNPDAHSRLQAHTVGRTFCRGKKLATLAAIIFGCGIINPMDAQQMKTLDYKDRAIAAIAAATATGDYEILRRGLDDGLDAGLTVSHIKEALVQLYAYCGFPRSLQALHTFMDVLDSRKASGIVDEEGPDDAPAPPSGEKYASGKAILQSLTGTAEEAPAGVNAFAPAIDVFLKEHLFYDIFGRNALSFKERELATVAALASMKGVEPMLLSHLAMARNTGWSRKELDEATAIATAIGDETDNPLFPTGNRGPAEWFTGEVYVNTVLTPEQTEGLYSVGQVTFMPGGRTHWHTHPIGQTLLVLGGSGWYQERGKPAQKLLKGSAVAIPKDVEHWHGASTTDSLIHIAISNATPDGSVTWMSPVSAEEYIEAEM